MTEDLETTEEFANRFLALFMQDAPEDLVLSAENALLARMQLRPYEAVIAGDKSTGRHIIVLTTDSGYPKVSHLKIYDVPEAPAPGTLTDNEYLSLILLSAANLGGDVSIVELIEALTRHQSMQNHNAICLAVEKALTTLCEEKLVEHLNPNDTIWYRMTRKGFVAAALGKAACHLGALEEDSP